MDGHFEEEFPPPPNPGQPGDTNNILIQRMASRYIPLLVNIGISLGPPGQPGDTNNILIQRMASRYFPP